jgi:hypothetical protein
MKEQGNKPAVITGWIIAIFGGLYLLLAREYLGTEELVFGLGILIIGLLLVLAGRSKLK